MLTHNSTSLLGYLIIILNVTFLMLKSKAEQCPDHLRKEGVSSIYKKVTSLGNNP